MIYHATEDDVAYIAVVRLLRRCGAVATLVLLVLIVGLIIRPFDQLMYLPTSGELSRPHICVLRLDQKNRAEPAARKGRSAP